MKLPYLKSWDKTPLEITMTEGMDENGAPKVVFEYEGRCNYKGVSRTVRSPDGMFITIGGELTIKGDIAPDLPVIRGVVKINGLDRNIHSSEKPLNPDGSVNHTRLELL